MSDNNEELPPEIVKFQKQMQLLSFMGQGFKEVLQSWLPRPLRNKVQSVMAQKSPDQHEQITLGDRIFGNGPLSWFRPKPPPAEPPKDPNQPPEGTIEYWSWCMKQDKEPQYGTKEHDAWGARQLDYRNHMWRLKRTSLVRGSVAMDKPARGTVAH